MTSTHWLSVPLNCDSPSSFTPARRRLISYLQHPSSHALASSQSLLTQCLQHQLCAELALFSARFHRYDLAIGALARGLDDFPGTAHFITSTLIYHQPHQFQLSPTDFNIPEELQVSLPAFCTLHWLLAVCSTDYQVKHPHTGEPRSISDVTVESTSWLDRMLFILREFHWALQSTLPIVLQIIPDRTPLHVLAPVLHRYMTTAASQNRSVTVHFFGPFPTDSFFSPLDLSDNSRFLVHCFARCTHSPQLRICTSALHSV